MTKMHERISFARKQAALNQIQVANALGITRESVSQWESGKSAPTIDNLVKFSRVARASVDWLLSDQSELTAESLHPRTNDVASFDSDALEPFRIAIESLATAILPRIPGAASAFLIDLNASLRHRNVPADEALPGILKDIGETSHIDATKAFQGGGRDGSARSTKRGS